MKKYDLVIFSWLAIYTYLSCGLHEIPSFGLRHQSRRPCTSGFHWMWWGEAACSHSTAPSCGCWCFFHRRPQCGHRCIPGGAPVQSWWRWVWCGALGWWWNATHSPYGSDRSRASLGCWFHLQGPWFCADSHLLIQHLCPG